MCALANAPWTIAAPTGHTYYFNQTTNQSTYTRPLPAVPVLSAAPDATSATLDGDKKKKKKEKPVDKTPIPGTDWIRVKTNHGNTFYMHTVKKESVWTVPEEIKDAVEQLEREAEKRTRQEEEEAAAEPQRLEAETRAKAEAARNGKRKAEAAEQSTSRKKKKTKQEEAPPPTPPEPSEPADADEDDEEWQRQMAEEMTAEAADEEPVPIKEPKMNKHEAVKQVFDVPNKIELSIDEGKALFKVC